MERSRNHYGLCCLRSSLVWMVIAGLPALSAHAAGPLAAKVTVTQLAGYSGGNQLAKPQKILIYDFALNSGDVQVDKLQAMRPGIY